MKQTAVSDQFLKTKIWSQNDPPFIQAMDKRMQQRSPDSNAQSKKLLYNFGSPKKMF